MPDLTPFAGFLAATAIGLAMSIAAFYFARKAGIATIQATLISTLKDSVDALTDKVGLLEAEVSTLKSEKIVLLETVQRLRNAVSDLAGENADLRRKFHLPDSLIDVPK